MSDFLNGLIKEGALFKPSANPVPAPEGVSEQEQERFYAQALQLMVREQLRPALGRARAGAKVPLHKVALQMQMGRNVDSSQERALALADMRTSQFHWDALGRGENKAQRANGWLRAAESLLEIRNAVHDAGRGPQPVLVQPLISLLDAWHNVPLLIAQKGVQAVNPKRVGTDDRLLHQWTRWVEAQKAKLESQPEATTGVAVVKPEGRPEGASPESTSPASVGAPSPKRPGP